MEQIMNFISKEELHTYRELCYHFLIINCEETHSLSSKSVEIQTPEEKKAIKEYQLFNGMYLALTRIANNEQTENDIKLFTQFRESYPLSDLLTKVLSPSEKELADNTIKGIIANHNEKKVVSVLEAKLDDIDALSHYICYTLKSYCVASELKLHQEVHTNQARLCNLKKSS
jgi:hypothetical protein